MIITTCEHPWQKVGIVTDGSYDPQSWIEVPYCFACCERLSKAELQRSRREHIAYLGGWIAHIIYWGDLTYAPHMAEYEQAAAELAELTAVHTEPIGG